MNPAGENHRLYKGENVYLMNINYVMLGSVSDWLKGRRS